MMRFSEEYGRLRALRATAREEQGDVPEDVVQCIWYDQLFCEEGLQVDDGRPLRVLSPGWWNRSEGPDFCGAQVELAGKLVTGDIEVHLSHGAWRQHGHHLDSRYDRVVLVVALETDPPKTPPTTSAGRAVPSLLLPHFLVSDIRDLADRVRAGEFGEERDSAEPGLGPGQCAAFAEAYGAQYASRLLVVAGEWRLLAKARRLRDRMERVGADQAVYETFLAACGFSRYKRHFQAVARSLPYDRARQLALRDPLILEAAFLQVAGLLPHGLPSEAVVPAHFSRLRALRRDELPGLKSLPLIWKRIGVRPNNYPERRLAGATLFLARTAQQGICEALERIWQGDLKPVARRKAFEGLFPKALGFWANHCTWTGKKLARPAALLGVERVRAIIGNVFVPTALAEARRRRDRLAEERILVFFAALPKESRNRVLKAMIPRFFSDIQPPKMDFRMQQGLLQIYQDWCEPNPSCRNCSIISFLDVGYPLRETTGSDKPR